MAVHLLAETGGEARAQVSLPSLYDSEDAEANTASASGAVSGQPRAVLWDPLTQRWDKLQKQLDDHGIQIGVRYDGEVFADATGGLHRGAAYLGNLNLQLTLDAQRLVGWPGATVFLYGLGIHGGRSSRFVGDAPGGEQYRGSGEMEA
jgi:carbohydrate-selective porin OprB